MSNRRHTQLLVDGLEPEDLYHLMITRFHYFNKETKSVITLSSI